MKILASAFLALALLLCACKEGETPNKSESRDETPPVTPVTPGTPTTKDSLTPILQNNVFGTGPGAYVNPSRNITYYSYDNFIAASKIFPLFLGEGDFNIQKKELAAFLANLAQEVGSVDCSGSSGDCLATGATVVQWNGLTYIEEARCQSQTAKSDQTFCSHYCDPDNTSYPCSLTPVLSSDGQIDKSRQFYGRGPLQLSWNYLYGEVGKALGIPDLWKAPQMVVMDGALGFKTAIYFWMTNRGSDNGKTPHEAMVQDGDFGRTIFVVNGAVECRGDPGGQRNAQRRAFYYTQLSSVFGVDQGTGTKLSCQVP